MSALNCEHKLPSFSLKLQISVCFFVGSIFHKTSERFCFFIGWIVTIMSPGRVRREIGKKVVVVAIVIMAVDILAFLCEQRIFCPSSFLLLLLDDAGVTSCVVVIISCIYPPRIHVW